MLRVKKPRELSRGILGYIRSHLWVSIMGSMSLLILVVVLIFQGYLKNAYYNYLLDETWKTESAVLSVASNSLDSGILKKKRCPSSSAIRRNVRLWKARSTPILSAIP